MSAKKSSKPQMHVPAATLEPTGMWYIRLRIKNADGDTMSYAIREPTEAKAIARAMAIKSGLRAETMEAKRRAPEATLREVVADYLASKEKTTSPSTLRGYYIAANNRFKKYMDLPLSQKIDWEEMIYEELEIKAEKTVKNGWDVVRPALRRAGLNPPDISIEILQGEHTYLMPDEIRVFIRAMAGMSGEIAALLALHSLRASELLGLTWDDVDLQRGAIRVHKVVVPNKDHKFVEKKTTKTPQSTRTVMIVIPRLLELLEAEPDKTGRVVRLSSSWLYKQINSVCEKNALPKVGIHGLRHTFASLCYFLRVPELEVCARGGWKDPRFVHRVYTHLAAMEMMTVDRMLFDWFSDEKLE